MLRRFAKLPVTNFLRPNTFRPFGTVDTVAPQSRERTIRDLRSASYQPINKLEFDKNDKCLLYFYRPRSLSYAFSYGKYIAAMAYIGRLIATNPFYMTFPAALPIMICLECWLFKRLYEQRKTIRSTIGEVYLLRDGETLEVIYQTKFWRKIKSDDISNYYYIPSLKSPPKDEQTQPLKGDLFPEEFPFNELKPAGWAWRKFFRNPRNYFVIPKHANYKNMEVLTAAMSGKLIDTSKQNVVEIDYDKKEKYMNV